MARNTSTFDVKQNVLTEACKELQSLKTSFKQDSVEYFKIQNAIEKIKKVIFNY